MAGWQTPINAGLRPPPAAASGIDRGLPASACCHHRFDSKFCANFSARAVYARILAAAENAQYGGYTRSAPGGQPPPSYAPYPWSGSVGEPPTESYDLAQQAGSVRSLARQTLAPQNAVRASGGVPPLQWSDRLADAAQDWADHLVATGQFAHRPDDPYGENLNEITGGSASPQQVVDAWADEARHYDIRTNTCTAICGHYAQIVWESTRTVGCGVSGSADREVWVREYDPPGNVVGYRPF